MECIKDRVHLLNQACAQRSKSTLFRLVYRKVMMFIGSWHTWLLVWSHSRALNWVSGRWLVIYKRSHTDFFLFGTRKYFWKRSYVDFRGCWLSKNPQKISHQKVELQSFSTHHKLSRACPAFRVNHSSEILIMFVSSSNSNAGNHCARFKTAADWASSGCFCQLETVFGTFLMSLKPATPRKLDAMES